MNRLKDDFWPLLYLTNYLESFIFILEFTKGSQKCLGRKTLSEE